MKANFKGKEVKLVVDSHKGKNIAIITFDTPNSSANVLGIQSMTELDLVLDQIIEHSFVDGIVFASAKKGIFVAGADVFEIDRLQNGPQEEAYAAAEMGKQVFNKIAQMKCPTVAAINGVCLGGGLELALSCKFRVAADNVSQIGLPETSLGFVPGWGGCTRLPELIGVENAINLITKGMMGGVLNAKKAKKLGLVDDTVSSDKLMERAMGIACGDQVKRRGKSFGEALKSYLLEGTPIGRNLLFDLSQKAVKRATKGKYPAPLEAVKVIKLAAEGRREEAFKAESRAFAKLATSRVSKNLVHVLFKAMQESKELPVKVSFSPAEKTVGVLGAGVMGAGIAQAALFAGYKVVLGDVKQEFVDNGVKKINDLFQPLVERGKMSKESFKENMSRLSTAVTANDNYKDFANCDLVIEAVLEDLDLKKRVLKGLEAVIPAEKNFIFASNTSSLSIDSMAEAAANPNRVVGIHFFNPVHKMLLVEVVKGKTSDANTVATAMDFAMKLKKTVIVTKDSPGFVVNRILAPYLREAIVLMQEGVPVEDIDKAMKDFGMPMGPLRLLDEVGLDVAGKVIHVMHDAFGERLAPPAIMLKLESLKLLGKKGGKGVYTYGNIKKGKREVYDATGVNPDVQTAIADYLASINSSAKKKTREEIQDRLALAMVNEAIRCQEEHIVDKANQLDLAMVLGTGFAPFEGGVIRYADKIGAPALKQKLNALASVAGDNYKPAQLLENKALQEKGFYSLNGNGKVPH